jgi:hypothetical protein
MHHGFMNKCLFVKIQAPIVTQVRQRTYTPPIISHYPLSSKHFMQKSIRGPFQNIAIEVEKEYFGMPLLEPALDIGSC